MSANIPDWLLSAIEGDPEARVTPERVAPLVAEPQFTGGGRVHNWRTVPDALEEHWGELDDTARALVVWFCQKMASSEKWE